MSKPMDPSYKALKTCALALANSPKRMRRPTLEYLWDLFVRHGDKVPEYTPKKVSK